MKRLFSRLTMIHDDSKLGFIDKVSGRLVKYWVVWNGHYWLAESKWSYRIRTNKPIK